MSAPLGLAVFGAFGRWGQAIVRALNAMPEAKVIAPCGRGDWQDALAHRKALGIDAVIIASPASSHEAQAVDVLHAGLPVFLEKPMALTPQGAERIAQAAAGTNLPILIDHTQLFHGAYTSMKRMIEGRTIKYIDSIGGGPGPVRPDCSALWDYAPHDLAFGIDLLGFGGEVASAATLLPDTLPGIPAIGRNYYTKVQFGEIPLRIYGGNGMTKRRQLQLWFDNDDMMMLDDQDPDSPLSLNQRPIPLTGPLVPPLTTALKIFIHGVHNGPDSDSRMGTALGVEVVRLLSGIDAAQSMGADARRA